MGGGSVRMWRLSSSIRLRWEGAAERAMLGFSCWGAAWAWPGFGRLLYGLLGWLVAMEGVSCCSQEDGEPSSLSVEREWIWYLSLWSPSLVGEGGLVVIRMMVTYKSYRRERERERERERGVLALLSPCHASKLVSRARE